MILLKSLMSELPIYVKRLDRIKNGKSNPDCKKWMDQP